MDRKEFIKQCGFYCLAAIGAGILLEGCKAPYYAPNTISGNKISIRKADFLEHKFILVKNERLQAPIYVSKLNEQEYSAVLMLCTHKGCELNPASNFLVCPCHGSEFSNTGKVLSPPAEQDLKKFNVSTDNENIYIQL